MRHESIIVVYDSCQAVAEEIASKLGAEAVSVKSLNHRMLESCQSLVLGIEFYQGDMLTPHWQYGKQTLQYSNLHSKAVAVFVATGTRAEHGDGAAKFCDTLKQSGAHIVGEVAFASSPTWNTDYWIGTVSPNI